MNKSKYRDRIELTFAGQGPFWNATGNFFGRPAQHAPVFRFIPRRNFWTSSIPRTFTFMPRTRERSHRPYGKRSAAVQPIIADSRRARRCISRWTTARFFKHGDSDDLARKLDYWIEHPRSTEALGARYAALGDEYRVGKSVRKMIEVYKSLAGTHSMIRTPVPRALSLVLLALAFPPAVFENIHIRGQTAARIDAEAHTVFIHLCRLLRKCSRVSAARRCRTN